MRMVVVLIKEDIRYCAAGWDDYPPLELCDSSCKPEKTTLFDGAVAPLVGWPAEIAAGDFGLSHE
jgi:hypothetical protein